MGLLTEGTPLKWDASKKYHAYIKEHGIVQFLHIYHKLKDHSTKQFLWGDEVEGILISMDPQNKKAKLALTAPELLSRMHMAQKILEERDPSFVWNANFVPEWGRFQVEATPARPYGGYTTDLRLVEANMQLRRKLIQSLLEPNQAYISMTTFPHMGVGDFVDHQPALKAGGPVMKSLYTPDDIIGAHPRFATLVGNIRRRRGSKVCIKLPLFQDKHTQPRNKQEEHEPFAAGPQPDEVVNPLREIHMDSMAFGMGSCCLQVTFQCRNLKEARTLYDHLAVLSPVMLALTAATPFVKGKVADTDVRWSMISQSVDDRTPAERGIPASDTKAAHGPIAKSRYDSIDCYISSEANLENFNDIEVVYDKVAFDTLTANGVDDILAKHIAHLFIRDPLVLYEEKIDLDDLKTTDHFENIQSTNWQSVRFKPPPANSPIGWRVEFRTMEIQLTDFENAAFTIFIALLSRAILFFDLNLYLPISKVDFNMATAHKRDAVRQEQFFFRTDIHGKKASNDDFELMTTEAIICGNSKFVGMIPLVETYLDLIKCDKNTRMVVSGYLDLIGKRARGELLTQAQFWRQFVASHPLYDHDSNISSALNYNIVETMQEISNGTLKPASLLGDLLGPQRSVSFSGHGTPLRGASFRHAMVSDAFQTEYAATLSSHKSPSNFLEIPRQSD